MTPSEQYSERLARREAQLGALNQLDGRIGTLRMGVAAAFLAIAAVCIARPQISAAWLLVPGVCFAALLFYHHRVRTRRSLAQRAVAFYRKGRERASGHWRGGGATGERFLDAHHLYGADLDLFGEESLYQLLCAARTPMGETALAQWLLAPADLDTIRGRQQAIADLRGRLDLREALAIEGEPAHIDLRLETIAAWADAPNELSRSSLRLALLLLATLAAASAAFWAVAGIAFPFLAVVVVEAALNYALRQRVQRAVSGVEDAYEAIKLMAGLLRRIESETFDAPLLRELSARLSSHALTASVTLSKLATIVNFVEARRNPFLTPLMLPLMYVVQSASAAEVWRREHGKAVGAWLRVLGEIEALASLAGFSFENPEYPFPEFLEGPSHAGRAAFQAQGLGHPLIAAHKRICNDVELSAGVRILLVSGSNMSGKSTLLRSVGINTVLAMAGAPVCAVRLQLTPVQVGASIRINDSLHEGSSRFYAEITRLRQLFEPARLPLLFLLDELLQGTNSTDRRIGAQGVVRALLERGAIGLVSTHDLALTDGTGLATGALKNVHFQDELKDGELYFDFRLQDGIVTHSNGVELMRAIGLDV